MNFEQLSDKLRGFNRYYEKELRPKLEVLEVERKEAFKQVWLTAVIGGGLSAFIFVFLDNALVFFTVAGVSFFTFAFFLHKYSKIKEDAKLSVMRVVCASLEFKYSLDPSYRKVEDFRRLDLVSSYNRESHEDEGSGALEGVDFYLQESKLVKITGSGKNKKRRTIFKGLLCHFDFHKNFNGTTIGKKDYTALVNFFSDAFQRGERVKLEDPEFESKFQVFSTDQVEARYLLTPGFMNRMLEMTRLTHIRNIQFAFDDGKLYMALESSRKFFEGGGHKLDSPDYVKNIIDDIALVFSAVETLNLTQETKV